MGTQLNSDLAMRSGIGLRAPHYRDFFATRPDVGFVEVHPENYLCGGVHRQALLEASAHYPISFHCVGLSLGGAELPSARHIAEIKALAGEIQPFHISDHASWSASGNAHLNDLLPLPYTHETLDVLCRNVDYVQQCFGRQIVVENPSTYLQFRQSDLGEAEFLNALCDKTGCMLLLDLNNIIVQSFNHGFAAQDYVTRIEPRHVAQYHLAGHTEREFRRGVLKIDTHNQPVPQEVWTLFSEAVRRIGPRPTLVEWDADLPPLATLVQEAQAAETMLHKEALYAAA
jgi:uncharacterized protein